MRVALIVLLLAGIARADSDEEMGRRVQALLHTHQAEIFACVARQPAPIAGEALIQVVVGSEDRVARAVVLKSDAPIHAAALCVVEATRAWSLSSLGVSEGDQVVFPLAFKPDAPPDASRALDASMKMLEHLGKLERPLSLHAVAFYVVEGTATIDSKRVGRGDVVCVRAGYPYSIEASPRARLLQIDVDDGKCRSSAELAYLQSHTPTLALRDGKTTVRLYFDSPSGGEASFAVDQLCAKKAASVPRHAHESDELLYILSGRGVTTLGDHDVDTKTGDFITIPRGTPHALRVDADLCAVQVYAPAGPEQRFKTMTKAAP